MIASSPTKQITLQDVNDFIQTATAAERAAIAALASGTPSRYERAASTLEALKVGDIAKFLYDSVQYEGTILKINKVTATVRIDKIYGTPRRAVSIGTTVRVGSGLLTQIVRPVSVV